MKKTLFLLVAILALSCCKDDDPDTPTNPIDQLPLLTHVGANTGGCLVNGEAFLPNYKSRRPLFCNYLDQKDFSLGISNEIDEIYHLVYIYIYIGNTSFQVGKTYHLEKEIDGNSKYGYYYLQYPNLDEILYTTNENITGELTITHHSFDNATLSGTFWFDAVNAAGEIIEVREGRFDMEY